MRGTGEQLRKAEGWLVRGIRAVWERWRVLGAILFASLLLSGCVEYDVGVNFESQTHGELVQHIQLGEQLTSFSGATVREWLDSIDRRARLLGGRTKRVSQQEMTVTIPFNNGAELEQKFNEFFNPPDKKKSQSAAALDSQLPDIKSHLSVTQNNFLLALRNRLSYELDMRSLGVLSSDGNVLVSAGSLLDLHFRLNTPWGGRSVETDGGLSPEIRQEGRQLVWTLNPGQVNHLEAIFWVPSPIGIGAVAIILLVAAGTFLKYRLLPAFGTGKRQKSPVEPKPTA
ncbi:MAG: DUF3153 domain-containing protein [Oscillatoria princeps RMCB-10]|nr:DUF3153 domain-containing protein [Oscillatoria princeps RMCB-10]